MTNGATDPLPEYYLIVKIAKYYGIDPMEVVDWPQYWINATVNVIEADNKVEQKQHEKAQRKANQKKRG